jgi:hypothetical protein
MLKIPLPVKPAAQSAVNEESAYLQKIRNVQRATRLVVGPNVSVLRKKTKTNADAMNEEPDTPSATHDDLKTTVTLKTTRLGTKSAENDAGSANNSAWTRKPPPPAQEPNAAGRTSQRTTKPAGHDTRSAACAIRWRKQRRRRSDRGTRAAAPRDPYDDADGAPPFAVKTGKDKTASWVHSISDAPPPPIEATIIDAPVHFAADNTPDAMMMDEDLTARELRHSRRKAKDRHHRDLDGYSTEDPEMRRRKRQDAAAAGGPRGGRPGMGGPVNSMGYDSMDGVKTFDGRPAPPIRGESKAGSWLKKITGL